MQVFYSQHLRTFGITRDLFNMEEFTAYSSNGKKSHNDTKNGMKVWERTDLQCDHIQGPGSSLLLYKNLLMVHMEGTDIQYIVALDRTSGETVWKSIRPQECYEPLSFIGKKAYITPLIIQVNNRDLMISNGSAVIIAYDPMTGEEVWRIVEGAESTVAMPVFSNGLLYIYTGFEVTEDGKDVSELLAIDPDGEGDITESKNIIWRRDTPPLPLPTPLVRDGLLYTIDARSTMKCIDALNGETVWSKKLKGKYHSSGLYADGNIYFSSIKGETIVLKEGRTLQVKSRNKLEGEIWTTPAFADGSMLIRTSKYLYRIQ